MSPPPAITLETDIPRIVGSFWNEHCRLRHAEQANSWAQRSRLVRGTVVYTLAASPASRRLAYLSIDMNILLPEVAATNFLRNRLVPGAIVLLDNEA